LNNASPTGQNQLQEVKMEALPYEAQTALVSLMTAMIVGGLVSVMGAPAVVGLATKAAGFAMRRSMVTSLGLTALAGGSASLANFLSTGDANPIGPFVGLIG
jgi:hypothetical protein